MEYLEVKITTNVENVEIMQALLSQSSFDSFVDDEIGFIAYVEDKKFIKNNVENELIELKNQFEFDFSVSKVKNKNWNEVWESNFSPVLVEGKCLIRANFHSKDNTVKDEVVITPKMSFGTGHHSTTYMMVNQMYNLDLENKSVLDMGCGTAVLAILAKKLGSAYTLGVDIDDWAVNNSIENCNTNEQPTIEIIKGGAEKLKDFQKFDVILANINRNILLDDMKLYNDALVSGGYILFSGFYTEDIPLIEKEAAKHNLKLIDQNERENWSLLHFNKH